MDLADIIILVAALVFSIITSLRKKKKKTAQPGSAGNPWDDITGSTDPEPSVITIPEADRGEVPELTRSGSEVFSVENETPVYEQRLGEILNYMQHSKRKSQNNSPKTSFSKTPSTTNVTTTKISKEPLDYKSEKTMGEIMEEFDLRTAVLYSEILKPKFEE